jgi:hypothetical protein
VTIDPACSDEIDPRVQQESELASAANVRGMLAAP